MNLLVKVCGLTRVQDAHAAGDAGADAVGFVFAESARRVTPEIALAISRELPSGVLRVAVMRHPTQDEWDTVADTLQPDVLQTDANDFAALQIAAAVRRWPVLRQGSALPAAALQETYVYEGSQSGRGQTVDWTAAADVARRGQMILAGGLGAHNVATAVRTVRPFGVDASSSLESAPGRKSGEKIKAFVTAAKAAMNDE